MKTAMEMDTGTDPTPAGAGVKRRVSRENGPRRPPPQAIHLALQVQHGPPAYQSLHSFRSLRKERFKKQSNLSLIPKRKSISDK